MKDIPLLLQSILLLMQILVLVTGVAGNKNLLTYYGGFAIWACIPNAILSLI